MVQLTDRANTAGFFAPSVSSRTLFGTIWTLTGLSLIVLPARLYARWTATKRLYWDDFLVTFACVISLAISITITIFHPVTIELMLIGANLKPFPPNVEVITMQFTRVFTTIPMFFYGGLWCIKLAFLLFFRRLELRNVTSLRRWWKSVLGITIVAFLLCYTVLPYRCTFVSFEVTASDECQTQGLSFVAMKLNTALDVITDCLIMSIPYLILRRVRISTHQKVVLCAVFSLVIITMTFAIVRAVVTTAGVKRQIDPLWLYLWTSIELNVAILVACVAPYQSLFTGTHAHSQVSHHPQNLRHRVRKFWTSSFSHLSRRTAMEGHGSTVELPYLAPWVEDGNRQPAVNIKYQDYGTVSSATRRKDPSVMVDMPYIAPWSNYGSTAVAGGSNGILPSPLPLAHLLDGMQSGHGVLPSARTSIEE